ncbi:MAG: methyltransferase domain-containing protein [Candidatus Brocadiia bacterium]
MIDVLKEILACPSCLGALEISAEGFACPSCNAKFVKVEGIPVLRPGPVQSPESPWPKEVARADVFASLRLRDELLLPSFVSDALGGMIDQIVERVSSKLGFTLDIESGTGRIIQALAEAPVMRSMLIATDTSPHILCGIAKAFKESGKRQPFCIAASPRQLPFRNSVIDRVVTLAGFNNIPNARLAAGEAARVLKPGGTLLFAHLLLLDPNCAGAETAEERHLADLISLPEVDIALRTFDMRITNFEEFASGHWPEHPDNVIPASGDYFSLALITAKKES